MNHSDSLSSRTSAALQMGVEERCAAIKEFEFIPTSEAIAALQWLSYLRRHEAGSDRPRGIHIVAAPGMGKSRILRHYAGQNLPNSRDDRGILRKSVVLCEIPEAGDLTSVRYAIIKGCLPGIGQRTSFRTVDVEEALAAVGCTQLLLDEFGNVLNSGRSAQQRSLALVRHLVNIGITVGIATTERLRTAISTDESLNSRFKVARITEWGEDEQFRSFLAGVERQLPFKYPSRLHSESFVSWFSGHKVSSTAKILNVIKDASCRAIRRGADNLHIDDLKEEPHLRVPPDVFEKATM
ncbi:TniB family NTP-binding protein [Luteimonas sp. WGS1318]|uniref:TniB family NTP-binding protein n=1 Tax=Luteimonas sp. WGS1318 TaxID=3366815 RepID=UPI00372D3CE5